MNSVNHLIINHHDELFFFHHPSVNTIQYWSSSKILQFTHSPSSRFSESLPHHHTLISSSIIISSLYSSSISHSLIHHVKYYTLDSSIIFFPHHQWNLLILLINSSFIIHQSFFHPPCRLLIHFSIIILHFQWTSPVLYQFSFPPTSSTISKSFHPLILFPSTIKYSSTTFPASTIILNYYSSTH